MLDLCGLKIIKSAFGVIGAIWALALIPQFVDAVFHIERPHAWGTAAGSILGMVLASTISVVYFRKAFAPASAMANKEVQVSNLSRRYNVVLPLIALAAWHLRSPACTSQSVGPHFASNWGCLT